MGSGQDCGKMGLGGKSWGSFGSGAIRCLETTTLCRVRPDFLRTAGDALYRDIFKCLDLPLSGGWYVTKRRAANGSEMNVFMLADS